MRLTSVITKVQGKSPPRAPDNLGHGVYGVAGVCVRVDLTCPHESSVNLHLSG